MMLHDGAGIGREDTVDEVFGVSAGVATSVDQLCRGCAVELCRGIYGYEEGHTGYLGECERNEGSAWA